jgi:hypothetical protein
VKRGPCPDGRVFAFIEVESTTCSLRTCATRSARPTARGRANTGPLNASPAELPSLGVAIISLHGDVVAGVARLATHVTPTPAAYPLATASCTSAWQGSLGGQ